MNASDLLEDAPDLISQHDASGVFVFASAAATSVLGRDAQSLVGTSIHDLAYAPDRARMAEVWANALRGEGPRMLQFRVERSETTRWVETNLRVVERAGAVSVVCSTRDVTTLVHERQERAKAELGFTHWKELVAQVPGIVWYAPMFEDGSRGSAEFISDYLQRVTGYTPHEWLTTPNFWASIIHSDDLEMTLRQTALALERGTPVDPYRVHTKDGRIVYFQSYMRMAVNAEGKPERLYGLTLDVTQFKESEVRNAALLAEVRLAVEEREVLLEELGRRAKEVLALSAPIIPVGERALVVPLIGALDEARGELLSRVVSDAVAMRNAEVVILDMTGVPSLDAEGANMLVRAAACVELLGARVMITGLRAEAAKTMVEMGLGLEGVTTRATLVRALEEVALWRRKNRAR